MTMITLTFCPGSSSFIRDELQNPFTIPVTESPHKIKRT